MFEQAVNIVALFYFFRIPVKTSTSTTTGNRNGAEKERDSYAFYLLAAKKENVDKYKVIKFNPCTLCEETIAHRLPYQLDCAMAALGGT